jgi:predicted dehydrogenase
MNDSSAPLGVALLGAGWMGSALLRGLAARPDAQVLALCQRNAGRGRAVLAEAGLPETRFTDDYPGLLARPEVEAVVICTPNHLHAPQALAALAAGKHVFCEKPAATHPRDHRLLVEAARRHPRQITLVDYILYFDPTETRLRALIAEGALGLITQIQVNYRHPINVAGDKAWKLETARMGDAIGMGINHALSVILFALAPQTRPARVYATSAPARVRAFESDPIWNILIEFADGAAGFCFGNIDSSLGYDATHSVYGDAGAFCFDSLQERPRKIRWWSRTRTGGAWVWPLDPACDPAQAWPPDLATPDSGNVIHHQTAGCLGHFLEHARAGRPSPLGFDHAADVAEVGWAARLSALRRRPVDLPLTPEDWAELDADADRLAVRPGS